MTTASTASRLVSSTTYRRHYIHLWRHIQQTSTAGLVQIAEYQRLDLAKLATRKVQMSFLGNEAPSTYTLGDVAKTFVRPGQMLLSYERRTESPQRASAGYYTAPIPTWAPTEQPISSNERDSQLRAYHFHVPIDVPADALQDYLWHAHHLLRGDTPGPKYPVEFHLRPPAYDQSLTWTSGHEELLSRYRVDLHPSVIQAAMPEGSLRVTHPRYNRNGTDLVWLCVPEGYSWGSLRGSELASKIETRAEFRAEWQRHLVDTGRVSEVTQERLKDITEPLELPQGPEASAKMGEEILAARKRAKQAVLERFRELGQADSVDSELLLKKDLHQAMEAARMAVEKRYLELAHIVKPSFKLRYSGKLAADCPAAVSRRNKKRTTAIPRPDTARTTSAVRITRYVSKPPTNGPPVVTLDRNIAKIATGMSMDTHSPGPRNVDLGLERL